MSDPQFAREQALEPSPEPRSGFSWPALLLREAPYLAMLLTALAGIAYIGATRRQLIAYWLVLAPIYCLICIAAGWRHLEKTRDHVDLVWTQALHWLAVLLAMCLVFLPSVSSVVNANATGLFIITLLALGTFVAGVHARSWRICLVGVLLGLAVPAAAWVEQSILLVLLCIAALVVVVALMWWATRRARRMLE